MTPSQRRRLSLPVLVVYWLLVAGGLAIYTSARGDASGLVARSPLSPLWPLWIGAVGGTLLGQFLALRDLRLWLALLLVVVSAYFSMPIMAAGWLDASVWKVLIPAALCGYWSLGDRSALAAFWFPAMIWMLSILDRTDGSFAPDGSGVVLLGGLAVLFLVFLRARESRRVGLWRTVSSQPLGHARPPALLKEPPGRPLARTGWGILVSAASVGITAWVAPQLWHLEPLRGDEVSLADPAVAPGLPCCPTRHDAGTDRARIKEYLDLGLGHDDGVVPSREGIDCQVCEEGSPVLVDHLAPGPEPLGVEGAPAGAPVVAGDDGAWAPAGGRPGSVVRVGPPEPVPALPAIPADPVESSPAPGLEAARAPEPPPPAPLHRAPPGDANRSAGSSAHASAPRAPHRAGAPSIVPWLLALAAAVLVLQLVHLGLRPLRRLVTVRHLRRPFWDETIDQRVSNSWQLALVGLRDAGWCPGAGEAPRELAARVGIEGVERCATILERARHGVGIDAVDVSDMARSADAAYRSARARLGASARVLAWLRWPLI
ncbi:MAG TPA: hypothetical protein VFT22_10140 [Kofleriaceae bacterium]|nr:hypothetical protein [Kofleriaceae bacterium]